MEKKGKKVMDGLASLTMPNGPMIGIAPFQATGKKYLPIVY